MTAAAAPAVAVAEQKSFDPGAETWPWNSSGRCHVGPENEVIRRAEREKRVGKMSNAAFPPGRHVTRSVVRCIARGRAFDDLEVAEGGFVGDACTSHLIGWAARAWVRYSQTTLAGAVQNEAQGLA